MKTLKDMYEHLKKDYESKRLTLAQIALKQTGFNQKKAAELLGVNRTTFLMYCKAKKVQVKNPEN